MTIPTEQQYPYENLDRLVRVVMRPKGMSAKSLLNALLYAQARRDAPISYDIACALDPATPRTVGIFTGASEPEHYPNGENDGPLGHDHARRGPPQGGPQRRPLHRPPASARHGRAHGLRRLPLPRHRARHRLAGAQRLPRRRPAGRHRRREGGHQPRRQGPLHHRLHPRGHPRQGRRPLPARRGAGRRHRQRLRRHQRDRLRLHLRRRCRRRPLGHRVPLPPAGRA